jgi:hypothetical protein
MAEDRADFDPLEGIDPDGRIPAPERPPELKHPERWRYLPEGRLKPGNLFQRFLVSSFIAPFFFRNGDVGVGGGLAITDIDFRQKRRREFAGTFLSYSEEGQQSYRFVWRHWLHHMDLPEGGVLQEERSFLRAIGGYRKTLTRRFFGRGPDTEEGDETSYTDESVLLELGMVRSFPDPGDPLVLEVGARGELHWLSGGEVGDVPSTEEVKDFEELFAEAESHDLGWLIAGLRWDTRDSQRNPYRGWTLRALAEVAPIQSGGEVGARFTLNGGLVLPVPGLFHDGGDPREENPPTDTLAFGALSQLSSGELPFFALPALGGSLTHRGFIEGRFRDRASWLGSAEYRFWVIPRGVPITRTIRIERIGAALFYELGSVAQDGFQLFRSRLHHSYGVGLRATLERAALFRVDLGFSKDGRNLSAGFGLSF